MRGTYLKIVHSHTLCHNFLTNWLNLLCHKHFNRFNQLLLSHHNFKVLNLRQVIKLQFIHLNILTIITTNKTTLLLQTLNWMKSHLHSIIPTNPSLIHLKRTKFQRITRTCINYQIYHYRNKSVQIAKIQIITLELHLKFPRKIQHHTITTVITIIIGNQTYKLIIIMPYINIMQIITKITKLMLIIPCICNKATLININNSSSIIFQCNNSNNRINTTKKIFINNNNRNLTVVAPLQLEQDLWINNNKFVPLWILKWFKNLNLYTNIAIPLWCITLTNKLCTCKETKSLILIIKDNKIMSSHMLRNNKCLFIQTLTLLSLLLFTQQTKYLCLISIRLASSHQMSQLTSISKRDSNHNRNISIRVKT